MTAFLVSLLGALFNAVLSAFASSSESSAKSEAEAAKHTTASVIESYETEREIRAKTEAVNHVDFDPTDIFGARAASPVR